MKTGWARIYRCIEDNPLWLGEKFSRGQAWIDLIVFANHKPGYFFVRGNRVDLDRGQIGWSQVTMARRWKWSRNKVVNFLKMLKKEQQIEQQKNTVTTVITIINYEKYQSERAADSTAEEQQKSSRRNTNKNVKNVKNVKKRESNHLSLTRNQKDKLTLQFPEADISLELRKANDFIKSEAVVKTDYLAWFRNWLRRSSRERDESTIARVKSQKLEVKLPPISSKERLRAEKKLQEIRSRFKNTL